MAAKPAGKPTGRRCDSRPDGRRLPSSGERRRRWIRSFSRPCSRFRRQVLAGLETASASFAGKGTLLAGLLPGWECGWIRNRAGSFVIRLLSFLGGDSPPNIPRMISIGLKLLDDGDSHSIEQWCRLVLHSLHDQRQEIPLSSRLKLERTYYSAMTPRIPAYIVPMPSGKGWRGDSDQEACAEHHAAAIRSLPVGKVGSCTSASIGVQSVRQRHREGE